MKTQTLKLYAAVLSTVLGIIISILDVYQKLNTTVPGLQDFAPTIITSVLAAVAIVLLWDRLIFWFARYPTISRVTLWAVVVAITLFIVAVQLKRPTGEIIQWVILVSLVVIGLTVMQRYSLETRATTQYLGKFPENLPTLIEIVEGANTSIKVLTDVFAYAAYSATANYNRLMIALEKRIETNKVNLTWCTYNKEKAKESVMKQLRLAGVVENSKEAKEFLGSEKMKEFVDTFKGIQPPRTILEFFETVLEGRNEETRKRLGDKGCQMQPIVSTELPLYIWLIDDRVAIFCVPIKEENFVREDTFITRDPTLLSVLTEVGNLYWRRA